MPVLINGEPFIHGLDPDVDAATAGGTNPTTDALAHQQNTDKGTTKPFFEIGMASGYANAGAIRRGVVYNSGGAGPITALAWEARLADGTVTGRYVICPKVRNGDPADINNVWYPAELAFGEAIPAGKYGANPELSLFRQSIEYILGQLAGKTPPVIGGFKPESGPVGTTVLINGNNFGATTGSVLLGSKPCNVQGWSNFQISVRVPAGAISDKFTVTTAGGSDISRETFTVTSAAVQTVPGPVLELKATPGNGQAVLEWVKPVDEGNAAINDYEIRYGLTGGVYATYAHSPRTASNIIVAGLTNGSEYEFTVAAKNPKGTGQAVGPVRATPVASGGTTPDPVYSSTYTPTAQDIAAKCGGSGGSGGAETRTASTQAAADTAAKNAAIAGIVCSVPVVYGNTLSINNQVIDGLSFVPQGSETFEIDSLAISPSGPNVGVVITAGGFTCYLDYNNEFAGKQFRFTDRAGRNTTGNLPSADTTLNY